MSKKIPGAKKPQEMPSADALHRVVEQQMDMLRAYKARQDRIVLGLGAIQKCFDAGSLEAAKAALVNLLATDLKQARDRVDNGMFALDIAIKTLEESAARQWTAIKDGSGPQDATPNERGLLAYVGETSTKAKDALSQIEILIPEAFEKGAAPAEPGVPA